MPIRLFLLCLFLATLSCTRRAQPHDFPRPIDTETRPVEEQEKNIYTFDGGTLTIDNRFDGARLNGISKLNDTLYRATILPENQPINASPWYALRIRSLTDRAITVRLAYPPGVRHRYYPKISTDRSSWSRVDSSALRYNTDSTTLDVRLTLLANQPYYLAGQEIVTSHDVDDWLTTLRSPITTRDVAGTSKLGRPIPVINVGGGGKQSAGKSTVVLLSRQHPPEVTGYLALQSFVERLLDHPRREEFLARYQLLVLPILNPDGVDLGYWRHNAGGIDLNRDWAYYRQPETRAVADYIVRASREARGQVVLGIDFHSTRRDVYYTLDSTVSPSVLPQFTDAWLRGIEARIGNDYRVNEAPGPIGRPTSDSWFKTQFNAEGITYEIGDDTDRGFVRRKGEVSADAMIEVLLRRP